MRVVLDTITEYQVLGNQYSVEYGGGAGVIINMVTRRGTNNFAGRVYTYFRDDKFNTRSPFLPADAPSPTRRTKQTGFAVGGPIVRNKRPLPVLPREGPGDPGRLQEVSGHRRASGAGLLAEFDVLAYNLFVRGDVQLTDSMFLSARQIVEPAVTDGDAHTQRYLAVRIPSARRGLRQRRQRHGHQRARRPGTTNVLRVGRTIENLAGSGSRADYYKAGENECLAGSRASTAATSSTSVRRTNIPRTGRSRRAGAYTEIRSTPGQHLQLFHADRARGPHLQAGGGFSRTGGSPLDGRFGHVHLHDGSAVRPGQPGDLSSEFISQVGACWPEQFDVESRDHRSYFFVEDRWRAIRPLHLQPRDAPRLSAADGRQQATISDRVLAGCAI